MGQQDALQTHRRKKAQHPQEELHLCASCASLRLSSVCYPADSSVTELMRLQ